MQPRPQEIEFLPDDFAFDLIYAAAKKQDEKKLNEALAIGSIEVYSNKCHGSPLTQLASEMNIKAVDFLIKHNANRNGAIKGFAQKGHITEAYAYFEEEKKDVNYDQIETLKFLIIGLTYQGNMIEARKIIDRVKQDHPNKISSILEEAIAGLTTRGFDKESYELLDQCKGDYTIDNILQKMAYGLGRHGNTDKIKTFLNWVKREHPTKIISTLKNIAGGLGQNGDEELIKSYLHNTQIEYPDDYHSVLASTVSGLSFNGHMKLAWSFLKLAEKKYPDHLVEIIEHIAYGISKSGNNKASYLFFERIKLKYPQWINLALCKMANGFISADQEEVALDLLDKVEQEHLHLLPRFLHHMAFRYAQMSIDKSFAFLERAKLKYPNHIKSVLNGMAEGLANKESGEKPYTFLNIIEQNYPQFLENILDKMALGVAGHKDTNKKYDFINKIKLTHPLLIPRLLNTIAFSIAQDQDQAVINQFLKMIEIDYPNQTPDVLEDIAYGFSIQGNKKSAYTILDRIILEFPEKIASTLQTIDRVEKEYGRSMDQAVVLKALAHIPPFLAIGVAGGLTSFKYNKNLVDKAAKLHGLMHDKKLTYRQALAWLNPEIPTLVLQCSKNATLPPEIYLHIASFLSPMTFFEAFHYTNKLAETALPKRFHKSPKRKNGLFYETAEQKVDLAVEDEGAHRAKRHRAS